MGESERSDAPSGRLPAVPGTAAYRVELLPWAEPADGGLSYAEGPDRSLLVWSRVVHALAAEVGEPEGVRTIIFDLVVERKESGCLVCRFDADPGPAAKALAARIAAGVGRSRCSRSLLDLAADGAPSRCFPDLESLAESALEELGF